MALQVGQPQDGGSKAGLVSSLLCLLKEYSVSASRVSGMELRPEDPFWDDSGREGVLSDLCGGSE